MIARIESLILGKDVKDALDRAEVYVGAGADCVMPHYKEADPAALFAFAEGYRSRDLGVPLVAIPSGYPQVTEEEF